MTNSLVVVFVIGRVVNRPMGVKLLVPRYCTYTSLIVSSNESAKGRMASIRIVSSSTIVTVGVSVIAGRPAAPSDGVADVPSKPNVTSLMLSAIVFVSNLRR